MGIYKFGNNTYPWRIRCRANLGHIFGGKKCVLWAGIWYIENFWKFSAFPSNKFAEQWALFHITGTLLHKINLQQTCSNQRKTLWYLCSFSSKLKKIIIFLGSLMWNVKKYNLHCNRTV